MGNVKFALNPDILKTLLKTKPVRTKRTPLWFFTNEIKSIDLFKKDVDPYDDCTDPSPTRVLKRTDIWNLWRHMKPEAKRRYFNMSKIDEIRYKEQRALWLAEIGTLILKQGGCDAQGLAKVLESFEHDQQENFIHKYKKNFNSMIQRESTRTLYKELANQTEKTNLEMSSEDIISDIPQDCRPILKQPRRPPSAFLLYANDNREKLEERKRSEPNSHRSYLGYAANQWLKLEPHERRPYYEKYSQLLSEYTEAMEKFKAELSESNDINFDQASKQKRTFRKNLRKRLREYDIIPVNVRNSFVFYLKENKGRHLSELTKLWQDLPDEEKLKYKMLAKEDHHRYNRDKKDFDQIKLSLGSLSDSD